MTDNNETVQVSFRCSPDLRQRLKVAAAEQATTVNALIVAALEDRLRNITTVTVTWDSRTTGLPVTGEDER